MIRHVSATELRTGDVVMRTKARIEKVIRTGMLGVDRRIDAHVVHEDGSKNVLYFKTTDVICVKRGTGG